MTIRRNSGPSSIVTSKEFQDKNKAVVSKESQVKFAGQFVKFQNKLVPTGGKTAKRVPPRLAKLGTVGYNIKIISSGFSIFLTVALLKNWAIVY